MGATENRTVLQRIFDEVVNQKNLDMADELYADEHELHPETPGIGPGPEGMKHAFAGLHEGFLTSGSRSSRWWPKGTWSPCV